MGSEVQIATVDVFLVLRDASGRILFGRRARHLYAGDMFNLISGKAEPGEDATTAMIREAQEEAGVRLDADDLRSIGAVHTNAGSGPRVGFVFTADHDAVRHGDVRNAEPDKCDGLVWADPPSWPQPLEPYNAAALGLLDPNSPPLALHGWGPQPFARQRRVDHADGAP